SHHSSRRRKRASVPACAPGLIEHAKSGAEQSNCGDPDENVEQVVVLRKLCLSLDVFYTPPAMQIFRRLRRDLHAVADGPPGKKVSHDLQVWQGTQGFGDLQNALGVADVVLGQRAIASPDRSIDRRASDAKGCGVFGLDDPRTIVFGSGEDRIVPLSAGEGGHDDFPGWGAARK